jgi:hypothetical protein
VTCENGLLLSWPGKPHKVTQVKRLKSSYSLLEHSRNCPGYQGYAYPKSHHVSERCNFEEAIGAILALQWWSRQVCLGQTVGLDTELVVKKRVLNYCCTCLKMQWCWTDDLMILWSSNISRWTKTPNCTTILTEFMVWLTHTWVSLPHWDDHHWKGINCS